MSRIDYSKWDNLDYSSSDEEERRNEEINKIETKLSRGVERLLLIPQGTISSSPLWNGLVTHHRDIFVSHVLPKLTKTDRFLFGKVNTESLDLIKYAGVDVSVCYIDECTSISTLELMWNKTRWGAKDNHGNVIDRAWFCWQVACTNKLELLKWAREVKHCEWHEVTINKAAYMGNLEMLKYCFANDCPYDETTACFEAAGSGHLDCLRFLFDKVKPLQETETGVAYGAAQFGQLDILKYVIETRAISYRLKDACLLVIAEWGRLNCLKYLVEEVKMPLNHWRYIACARYHEHPECVDYLREKEAPEPTDEQYNSIVKWYEDEGIERGAPRDIRKHVFTGPGS